MALAAGSTLQNALDQYNNTLNYEGNLQTLQDHVAAIRFLIISLPLTNSIPGRSFSLSPAALEKELVRLESKLDTTLNSNRVTFVKAKVRSF